MSTFAAGSVAIAFPTCSPWDFGCIAHDAAQSAFESIVKAIGEAVVTLLQFMSTFWLALPSPVVASGSGGNWSLSSVVGQMQGWLSPVTGSIAIISFTVAIGRIAFTGNGHEARMIVRQVAAVAAGSLAVAAATQLLIRGGDEFSPWIISRAAEGREPSDGLKMLVEAGFQSGSPTGNIGLWFLMFLLAALGSIVQCVFMLVRAAALVVLMVIVPSTAAAAASDEGWTRFKRLAFIIIGFALYKPVAAIIYATGIMLMTQQNGGAGNDVQNALYGLTVIGMAALALPAFIKFLLPLAATGSSSAFSGAAAAGVVAGGAAVVALGWASAGTGGVATAAAGGGGGAGPAGAAAVPPAGGAAPAGGGGGGAAPAPTGGSGGGGGGGGGSGGLVLAGAAQSTQSGAGQVAGGPDD